MRAEPIFIQIQTEAWSFGNREYALPNHRFRTLRHLLFIAAKSAQGILHTEEVLSRSTDTQVTGMARVRSSNG